MSGRLFLVTGGCGFIGSHLADALLARGDRVRVLDDLSSGHLANCPRGAELLHGCVTDASLVRRALDGADGCFHLAAVASVARCTEDWAGTHRINLGGTIAVLDAARAGRLPVVYASSAAVYGATDAERLSEDAPLRPISAYGADKLGSELHAAVAHRQHGVPTLGLRFFNVYGPRQDGGSPYSGVISAFCERLRRGLPPVVRGDGGQTRDFVFVSDVVEALLAGMDGLGYGRALPPALNVCTGQAVSVAELARLACDLFAARSLVEHAPGRADDLRRSCGDPSLLRASLGIVAATALARGLRLTAHPAPLADAAAATRGDEPALAGQGGVPGLRRLARRVP